MAYEELVFYADLSRHEQGVKGGHEPTWFHAQVMIQVCTYKMVVSGV
jgi:hypothetical protein